MNARKLLSFITDVTIGDGGSSNDVLSTIGIIGYLNAAVQIVSDDLVTCTNFWKSYQPLSVKDGIAREARLHMAVSSGTEFSMVSIRGSAI